MLRFPSPSLAVSMVALVVALGGAGYSATGGNFILGQANTASTQTRLVAPFDGAALHIANFNTGANAAGLRIFTDAARPPMFVSSGVKVANLNADKLDGIDSTGFMQGAADASAIALAAGGTISLGTATGGFIFVTYSCPAAVANNGTLTIKNLSTGLARVFVDNGGGNPVFNLLSPGEDVDFPASAAGDAFSIQASAPALGVASIEVATVHTGGQCFAQSLGMVAI